MKHPLLLLTVLLLAGCDRSGQPAGNSSEPSAGQAGTAAPGPKAAGSGRRLTGLYEGGSGAQKNQLCLVEKGREAEFGLIVWGGNLHSCSGAGVAVRQGKRLSLRMTGDETCTIEAAMNGGTITLPATLPAGCAYYCGARATLAGATFERSGDDARKATDIAGDPLCD